MTELVEKEKVIEAVRILAREISVLKSWRDAVRGVSGDTQWEYEEQIMIDVLDSLK